MLCAWVSEFFVQTWVHVLCPKCPDTLKNVTWRIDELLPCGHRHAQQKDLLLPFAQPRECFVVFHHFHYSRLSRRVMAECVCAWRGKIQRVTTWFTHNCLHTYGPQHHPPNRNLLLQQSCLNSIFSTPFSLWWQSLALRLFSFWPQHFQINSRGITTSSNNGYLRLLWIWYVTAVNAGITGKTRQYWYTYECAF